MKKLSLEQFQTILDKASEMDGFNEKFFIDLFEMLKNDNMLILSAEMTIEYKSFIQILSEFINKHPIFTNVELVEKYEKDNKYLLKTNDDEIAGYLMKFQNYLIDRKGWDS